MPKSFRDLLAESEMDLGPSLASGGAAVLPLPDVKNPESKSKRTEQLYIEDESGPVLDVEYQSEGDNTKSLRDFFIEPNGKQKLKEADDRAKQQIKSKEESLLEGVIESV